MKKPLIPSVTLGANYSNLDRPALRNFSMTIPKKNKWMLEGTSKKLKKSKECMIMCKLKSETYKSRRSSGKVKGPCYWMKKKSYLSNYKLESTSTWKKNSKEEKNKSFNNTEKK